MPLDASGVTVLEFAGDVRMLKAESTDSDGASEDGLYGFSVWRISEEMCSRASSSGSKPAAALSAFEVGVDSCSRYLHINQTILVHCADLQTNFDFYLCI